MTKEEGSGRLRTDKESLIWIQLDRLVRQTVESPEPASHRLSSIECPVIRVLHRRYQKIRPYYNRLLPPLLDADFRFHDDMLSFGTPHGARFLERCACGSY